MSRYLLDTNICIHTMKGAAWKLNCCKSVSAIAASAS